MNQEFKFNESKGLNTKNIKVATATESAGGQSRLVDIELLPIEKPILCDVDVYEVNTVTNNESHTTYVNCNSNARIHCKITVTPGAKFKSISKAVLKLRHYAGDLEGFAVFPANDQNMVEATSHPWNFLDYETDANGTVTNRLIDISDFIKNGEARTFYIAIKSLDSHSCALYASSASVDVMYVEDDDFIPNVAKIEKSVGEKGKYISNVRNGKLSYTQTLFEAKGARLPFKLSMSYNAADCDKASPCGISTGMKGWAFNYHQFLETVTDIRDDVLGVKYMDGGHLYHMFERSQNNANVMCDVRTKSGLILNGGVISDGKNTTLTFSGNKLTEMATKKGTATMRNTISYNDESELVSVVDGLGDTYNFVHDTNSIVVKKGTDSLVEITLDNERVTQVKYCKSNQTTTFEYNDNCELVSVFDSASNDKVVFEYQNSIVKAIKHYKRKVDASGNEISCLPMEAFFVDYNCLCSHVKFCRASDMEAHAYKTMQYQFAEDGELINSTEVKGVGFSGIRYRTRSDFEKFAGAMSTEYKHEATFTIGENSANAISIASGSLSDTKEQDSDEFTINNSDGLTENFAMSMAAFVENSGCVVDETSKSIEVQLLEGSTVLGTIYVQPGQRGLQVGATSIKLSKASHTLKFKAKVKNIRATVVFSNLRIAPIAKGVEVECVNVATGGATYTEHYNSSTRTWYVNKKCTLKYNGSATVSNVKFTAKDYMLTLISKNANASAFNVWFNDGANVIYNVSSLAICWQGSTFVDFDSIMVGKTKSLPGKQIYSYAYKTTSYPIESRQVTDLGSTGLIKTDRYNAYHLPVFAIDENGVINFNYYNEYGEVTLNRTDCDESNMSISQNYEYDEKGNLIKETEQRQLNTYAHEYRYDDDNILVEENMPNDQAQSFEYSADKEKLTKVSSVVDGTTVQTLENQINYDNNLISSLVHNGTTFLFGYDSRNNVSSVVINNAMSFNKNLVFNVDGTMTSETTYGNGQRVKKYYDQYDRLIKITQIEVGSDNTETETVVEAYLYSDMPLPNGNITDPESSLLQRSSASLLRATYSPSGTLSYTYDELGQLKKVAKGSFTVETTAYDAYGRPTTVQRTGLTAGTSNSVVYENAASDIIKRETATSTAGAIEGTYSYDALMRPIRSKELVGNNGHYKDYSYYPTQEKQPSGGLTPILPILPKSQAVDPTAIDYILVQTGTTNYMSAIKHYNVVNGTATLEKTEHIDYDANGNIVSYGGTTYVYDGIGRLIRENNPTLDKTIVWTYDVGGNIVSRTEHAYTTGTVGSATATNVYTYGNSNWKDQLTSFNGQAITYDNAGNPVSYRGKSFVWTRGRILAEHTTSSGNIIRMSYDGNGQRRSKGFYTSANALIKSVGYNYDGDRLISEVSMIMGTSLPAPTERVYLYNKEGVCGYVENGTLYTYRKNLFGDITAIYCGTNKVAEYAYDAYGNCTIVSQQAGIGTLNPFRYRGYYWDSDLGLYYLQTRYYDPVTGRFINADGLEYLDPQTLGGINLYSYCGNNPIMETDPHGTIVLSALFWGFVIGFITSFAASLVSQYIENEGKLEWEDVGVAVVEGLFGGLSGVLAASGACGTLSTIVDIGLDVVCSAITAGIECDWQFGYKELDEILTTMVFSVVGNATSDMLGLGFDNVAIKRVNEQVSNVNKKIGKNAYKNVIEYNEAVARATKLVKNSFNSASVRGAFAFNGAVSICQTIVQELVK